MTEAIHLHQYLGLCLHCNLPSSPLTSSVCYRPQTQVMRREKYGLDYVMTSAIVKLSTTDIQSSNDMVSAADNGIWLFSLAGIGYRYLAGGSESGGGWLNDVRNGAANAAKKYVKLSIAWLKIQ